jgi:hypothetical protein
MIQNTIENVRGGVVRLYFELPSRPATRPSDLAFVSAQASAPNTTSEDPSAFFQSYRDRIFLTIRAA